MKTGLFTGLCAVMLGVVSAQAVVIDASYSGWYRANGYGPGPDGAFITVGIRTTGVGTYEYRNYFAFDLSSVTDQIVGAYFEVWNHPNGFVSEDVLENYRLFEVSTAVEDLVKRQSAQDGDGNDLPLANHAPGQAIFGDLGTGTTYGWHVASANDNGQLVQITLLPDAIAALNDAINGWFAFGGAITSLDGHNNEHFLAAGKKTDSAMVQRLVLETRSQPPTSVPDQGTTVALLGLAMMGLGLIRNRMR